MPIPLHLHLDPLGGIAGDMFIAALVSAFPDFGPPLTALVSQMTGTAFRLTPVTDAVLAGQRFQAAGLPDGGSGHAHHRWADIRASLADAPIPAGIRRHAIGIFTLLAEAEARIHGVSPDQVSFHEIGNRDSIADILGAAFLLDSLGPSSWSVGPLPLGRGQIMSDHGLLPIPAPATALLLEGFAFEDDALPGERVTPTGAAILRYIGAAGASLSGPARLLRSGIGYGTRHLPGRPNILRVMAFAPEPVDEPDLTVPFENQSRHRHLGVISFEIDDQSGEELAMGLDRLRALPGVHDVLQLAAFGKKGRMATQIQLLCRVDALEAAIAACFTETTTIGLRTQIVEGHALPRQTHQIRLGQETIRVKSVLRPDGPSAKAEIEDVRRLHSHAARALERLQAEKFALIDLSRGDA